MFRTGPRFFLTTFALFAVTLFVAGGFAQSGEDPRNSQKEYFDAINNAQCFSHHGNEGFRPMDIRFTERYSQLPIGEEVDLKVRVQNPWKHNVQQISVAVDTSAAPNVRVQTPDAVEDTEHTAPATLTAGGRPHSEKFAVRDGAEEVYVAARIRDAPFGSEFDQDLEQSELTMEVTNKAGTKQKPIRGDSYAKSLTITGDDLVNAGTGNFTVAVGWETTSPVVDQEMNVEIVMMVNYTQREEEAVFRLPDEFELRPDETVDVIIPIVLESQEEAMLDFRIQSVAYWDHSPSDAAPRDDGLYYRFMTMNIRGGDSVVRVDSNAFGPQPVGPAVDLYNLFTRILGFVAALLIPISMLTGGIFGKGSRRWLNKVTGGAKKRVLWHSAMSWMILAVASFHFILALIEAKFVWTKGLLWGGVGWALLISLGFTGYYQVRMIKRWNYKVWRHTHLWSAVAVLGFTLVHLLLDGSDLSAVRDALPGWHEKLIWP